MSDTADRLAAYKAAELQILKAQSMGVGDRRVQMAELAEVRKAINELEAKLTAEQRVTSSGSFGPITLVGSFNKDLP